MEAIQRIHHVSALGGSAQETIDFYRQVLELELIKATVNFAGGDTYHLFFANQGTQSQGAMTYFDWSDRQVGHKGGGHGGQTAFRVPQNSLAGWWNRLKAKGVKSRLTNKFGQETLEFHDPFGIDLALVEGVEDREDHRIYDFHGFELYSSDFQATATHLINVLGLEAAGESDQALFFDTQGKARHRILVPKGDMQRRGLGQGTVDHIAFEVKDKQELDKWRAYLAKLGFENTDLTGLNFKKQTYYNEPGDVRIELITRGMGILAEPEEDGQLGKSVVIPPHLKDKEEEILANLQPLDLD